MSSSILIVEDEALIAMSIEIQLQDMGFNTIVVSSVTAAEAALLKGGVDLAILDYTLRDGEKTIPVAAGDECLLFLWLQPHGWDILNWHVQFRQSRETPGIAEAIGAPELTRFVSPTWVGPSVKASFVGETTKPDWTGLVTEVRRLGAQAKR